MTNILYYIQETLIYSAIRIFSITYKYNKTDSQFAMKGGSIAKVKRSLIRVFFLLIIIQIPCMALSDCPCSANHKMPNESPNAKDPASISHSVSGIAEPAKMSNHELPTAHTIANIPWHQQLNALECGDGALEIVFDSLGQDIDQKQIADVARTSSAGTWTYDMVRAGQFSYMSSAQGRFYPGDVPTAGYPSRPIGYATFSYSGNSYWLDDLKALIAADIPVIVLTTYNPDGTGGGHYKPVIGYNDTERAIYFSDPWGRDLKHQTNFAGITKWSYDEFQRAWNYSAAGEGHPYFGMITLPWSVDIGTHGSIRTGSTAIITANITYPCPLPFDRSQFPAKSCIASINLPDGMSLASGSSNIPLGDMKAGSTVKASWKVNIDKPVSGESIAVKAQGIISGGVPEAYWNGESVIYPPYDYTDAIGGDGSIML